MTESAVAQIEAKIGTYEDDRKRWCQMLVKSGLAPKSLSTPEKVFVAVEAGCEAGLSPLQALSSVYVINGMPAWTGQGALALIRGAGICSLPPTVRFEGEGDAYSCVIAFQRADMPQPETSVYTVADAKRAKLWGKSGPWTEHPDQMLQWRAVSRMASFYFSDVLKGHGIAEVARDRPIPVEASVEPPPTPDPLLAAVASQPEPETDPATGEEIPDYIDAEEQEQLL